MAVERVARRIYGWLLVLYPAEFRRTYRADMVQVFGDLWRDAHSRGALTGMIRLAVRVLLDVIVTACVERTRTMQQERQWIPVLGALLLVAPVLFVSANVMKFELGIAFLYDGPDSVIRALGLESWSQARDLLVISAPLVVMALALWRSVRVAISTQDGALASTIAIRANRATLALMIVTGLLLVVMVGYAFVENLGPI